MDGTMTKVLVGGAGGFIGGHLVRRLKREGFWVRPKFAALWHDLVLLL